MRGGSRATVEFSVSATCKMCECARRSNRGPPTLSHSLCLSKSQTQSFVVCVCARIQLTGAKHGLRSGPVSVKRTLKIPMDLRISNHSSLGTELTQLEFEFVEEPAANSVDHKHRLRYLLETEVVSVPILAIGKSLSTMSLLRKDRNI